MGTKVPIQIPFWGGVSYLLPMRSIVFCSDEHYLNLCHGGFVERGTNAIVLTTGVMSFGGAMGIDYSALMPPWFPCLRSSDRIFGYMSRLIHGSAVAAHLPLTVEHAPKVKRHFQREDMWQNVTKVRMSDLVVALLTSQSRPVGTPETRLRAIGVFLEALGSTDRKEFEFLIRSVMTASYVAYAGIAERLLRTSTSESFEWRRDTKRQIECIGRAIESDGLWFAPVDVRPGASDVNRLSAAQDLLRRYGGLVRNWESIVEAAGENWSD